jgi:hypothetical protein
VRGAGIADSPGQFVEQLPEFDRQRGVPAFTPAFTTLNCLRAVLLSGA